MAMRLDSIMHAGGVNSIDRFASSWQRAAGFFEITPVRPSFRFTEEGEEGPSYTREDVENTPDAARSLLREAFNEQGRRTSDNVVEEGAPAGFEDSLAHRLSMQRRRMSHADSIFAIEPSLDSPFGGSYGTQYGSLGSRLNRSSIRHAAQLFNEQQAKGVTSPDKEREPLLVKTVEEDGVAYNVVVGQSTLPQTIFNSVNVLIGVGLLSLPLAIHYSGWVVGMLFYLFAVITTQYTAKLLAKCLDVDSSLITFADLAYVSFGQSARVVVSILFTLELLGANVALVVLFADSLDDLIPGIGVVGWKIIAAIILVPLAFLPLRLLSFTSILGILSCLGSKSCLPHDLGCAKLTMYSRHPGFHRRSHQTRAAWVTPPARDPIPLPDQLDNHTFVFGPAHVALGWPLRLPKHLPRHATSIQVPPRCRHHLRLHIRPRPRHGRHWHPHVRRRRPRRDHEQHPHHERLPSSHQPHHRDLHRHHPCHESPSQCSPHHIHHRSPRRPGFARTSPIILHGGHVRLQPRSAQSNDSHHHGPPFRGHRYRLPQLRSHHDPPG